MAGHADQLTAQHSVATSLVQVTGLVRGFDDKRVLDGVDLEIAAGEFVAILGPSGCGKSTLLRALAGLDDRVAGSGRVQVPPRVSVLFQDSRLLPWASVLDNVVLGRRGRDAGEQGRSALSEVGLSGREKAWPHELSGGEQQRVALARALISEPQLLLADEPFGALDALTRLRMHDLLRDLHRRHRPAVLLVTHDVDEAITLADRIVVLGHGRITWAQQVQLSGERDPSSAEFADLRRTLLGALGVRRTEQGGVAAGVSPGVSAGATA